MFFGWNRYPFVRKCYDYDTSQGGVRGVRLESDWSPIGVRLESEWSPSGVRVESDWSPIGVRFEIDLFL